MDAGQHVKTIHVRQTDIQQHQVGRTLLDAAQSRLAIDGLKRGQTELPHEVRQHPARVRQIVNDQHLGNGVGRGVQRCHGVSRLVTNSYPVLRIFPQ